MTFSSSAFSSIGGSKYRTMIVNVLIIGVAFFLAMRDHHHALAFQQISVTTTTAASSPSVSSRLYYENENDASSASSSSSSKTVQEEEPISTVQGSSQSKPPPSSSLSSQSTASSSSESSTRHAGYRPVSWIQSVSLVEDDYTSALQELLMEWNHQEEEEKEDTTVSSNAEDNNVDDDNDALAFIFISPPWADKLPQIADQAQTMLGPNTTLITVVGSGVVSNDQELEDSSNHMMSFFGGILPINSSVVVEEFTNTPMTKKDEKEGQSEQITGGGSGVTKSAAAAAASTNQKSRLPYFATEASKVKDTYTTDVVADKKNDKRLPTMEDVIEQSATEDNEDEAKTSRRRRRRQSHIIFSDPYFQNIQDVLDGCVETAVAGAVTVASHNHQSTIAVGRNVLQAGSLICASLHGNIGLQVVVSTGCRPIGPTYRVTKVNGPAVEELDHVRAVDQLESAIEAGCNQEDQALIRSKGIRGVLGGILQSDGNDFLVDENIENAKDVESPTSQPQSSTNKIDNDQADVDNQKGKAKEDDNESLETSRPQKQDGHDESSDEKDFILRQVTGFQPKSGSILVCGRPQVQLGDYFRFHIRSASSARKDWEHVVSRAKAERLFLGPTEAGTTLGALQFSCAARGSGLFSEQDVDLRFVHGLLGGTDGGDNNDCTNRVDSSKADNNKKMVAGFFTSAEIGPSSSSLSQPTNVAADAESHQMPHRAFLHGFATVVALVCDYSIKDGGSPDHQGDVQLDVVDGILHDVSNSNWA